MPITHGEEYCPSFGRGLFLFSAKTGGRQVAEGIILGVGFLLVSQAATKKYAKLIL